MHTSGSRRAGFAYASGVVPCGLYCARIMPPRLLAVGPYQCNLWTRVCKAMRVLGISMTPKRQTFIRVFIALHSLEGTCMPHQVQHMMFFLLRDVRWLPDADMPTLDDEIEELQDQLMQAARFVWRA